MGSTRRSVSSAPRRGVWHKMATEISLCPEAPVRELLKDSYTAAGHCGLVAGLAAFEGGRGLVAGRLVAGSGGI